MKTQNNRYFIGFLGALIIFISIGAVSYFNLNKDDTAGTDADNSYEILNSSKVVENHLKDINLSRRGYIMSNDMAFLNSIILSKQLIASGMEKISRLTGAEDAQQVFLKELKCIIAIEIFSIEKSISVFQLNGKYDSFQKLISSRNLILNKAVENLFSEIETYHKSYLEQRINDESSASELTRKFILTGNLFAIMLIIISFYLINKQRRKVLAETEAGIIIEQELKSKQNELELLMNIMPVGVYYVDDNERCTYVNDTWCKMTGYSADDVYGTNLTEIVHPDDREHLFNTFMKAIEAGKAFNEEYRYVCKNGEIKYILGQASIRIDTDGKMAGVIGSVIDITKQYVYHEELIKFNTLFESIAEGIPDSIFVKDINGNYDFINTPGAKMIGLETEKIIGKNDFELYPASIANDAGQKDKMVYAGSGNLNYEVSSVMPDGTLKTFLTTKGLLRNSKNEAVGLFGIQRDITTMKEKETHIKRSLAEKEMLLRETHHRVKNNLQVVASLLNLQSGYIKDIESKQFFQDSQNRIKTIAALHEKLYGSQKYTSIELKKYIEQLMEILVTSFGINTKLVKIVTDIDEMNIDIEYSVPIGLIINEIITNSFKYAFNENQPGEIFIRVRKIGEELMINIGDNGKGLSEELDIQNLKSLGLQLIFTLIEGQLSGKVKFLPSPSGLVFGITIPMKLPVLSRDKGKKTVI